MVRTKTRKRDIKKLALEGKAGRMAVQRGPEKRLGQELRRRAKEAVEVLEQVQRAAQHAKRKLGAMLPRRSVG